MTVIRDGFSGKAEIEWKMELWARTSQNIWKILLSRGNESSHPKMSPFQNYMNTDKMSHQSKIKSKLRMRV